MRVERINTPLGELQIVADNSGNLRAVDWTDYEPRMKRLLRLHYGDAGFALESGCVPNGLAAAIGNYFEGERGAIDSLPVETGGTDFQREVWCALRRIPCGVTISYAQLAERIGRPVINFCADQREDHPEGRIPITK